MKIAKERGSTATAIIFALILIAVLSAPAFAQSQCLDAISTTASASRATTGTSVTITVTTSGSSCTVQTLSLVSSPSLTVNDPASGQYAGFTAGTAKTFTVTAGTTGTYSYYARGTTSGGSRDSTEQILEIVSPGDLTVTASPSSASVTQGNTFSLTIDIQNPQTSDVSTSYAINLPSGLTRSAGDVLTSSGTTVSASSTKRLSLTIAHTTCMTSGTITFDLGSSTGVASVNVTGNSTCASGTSNASSSTGGGGGGGPTVVTEAHTFTLITPGVAAIKKFTNTAFALKEISIEVNNPASTVRITVTKLAGQPASITKTISGKVFQYLEINASNLAGNIKTSKLTFEVTKSWLTSNGFEASHVVLLRYTGSDWEKLPATKVSEDANNVKYEATTPGYSVFAITAEKPAPANETTPTAPTTPTTPSNETTPTTPGEQPPENQTQQPAQPQAGLDAAVLAVIIVAIVAVAGTVYYMVTQKKKSKGYSYKSSK